MADHGVPRVSSSGSKSGKEREKELREIEGYKNLVNLVNKCIVAKELNYETLNHINKLLKKNPEYYTMWNNRRRVLKAILADLISSKPKVEAEEQAEEIIRSDLEFLLPLLVKFPKCYWIWNHRWWLLQQTSTFLDRSVAYKFWQHELGLVAEMFRRDNRNFHGWDYRRKVIAALREFADEENKNNDSTAVEGESLTEQEFAFTTKLVRSNLSNFSAWHNRSQLIPQLLDEREADQAERRKLFETELTFIDDALSTDPYDQSLWYYHRFLMSILTSHGDTCFGLFTPQERQDCLKSQIELFREVLEDSEDCKWIYQNLLYFAEESLRLAMDTKEVVTPDEMRIWLDQLKKLDPQRSGRWESWESRLNLT